jgi:hypothetical protein
VPAMIRVNSPGCANDDGGPATGRVSAGGAGGGEARGAGAGVSVSARR